MELLSFGFAMRLFCIGDFACLLYECLAKQVVINPLHPLWYAMLCTFPMLLSRQA